jgi:hypothetical protein
MDLGKEIRVIEVEEQEIILVPQPLELEPPVPAAEATDQAV